LSERESKLNAWNLPAGLPEIGFETIDCQKWNLLSSSSSL